MIVGKPGGEEIDRTFGFVAPREFIKTVNNYQRGIGTLAALLEAEKDATKNSDAEFYYRLGERLFAHSRFDDADARFQSVQMIDTQNKTGLGDDAMYRRVLICNKTEEWITGLGLCRNLESKYPKSEFVDDAVAYVGHFYQKAGNAERAIAAFEDYLARFPKGEDAEWAAEQIEKLKSADAGKGK